MANISVSLPSDGQTIDAADYNTPINTIVTEFNGNIDNSNIAAAAAIAGTKIADGAITGDKLATSAITLGYAQITSTFTTSSTSATLVTGLTATVTIPAGNRRIKITFQCRDVFRTGGGLLDITLWDGTVGSGTQLQGIEPNMASGAVPGTMIYVSNTAPSAGSKTYNIGMSSSATANASIEATATAPAFILVEVI